MADNPKIPLASSPSTALAGAQDKLRPLAEVEMPHGQKRSMGVSTALDTNGNGGSERSRDRIDVAPRFTQADVIRLNNLFRGQDAAEVVASVIGAGLLGRSEEHTSELQSLMRISYAVFCLKKKTN